MRPRTDWPETIVILILAVIAVACTAVAGWALLQLGAGL